MARLSVLLGKFESNAVLRGAEIGSFDLAPLDVNDKSGLVDYHWRERSHKERLDEEEKQRKWEIIHGKGTRSIDGLLKGDRASTASDFQRGFTSILDHINQRSVVTEGVTPRGPWLDQDSWARLDAESSMAGLSFGDEGEDPLLKGEDSQVTDYTLRKPSHREIVEKKKADKIAARSTATYEELNLLKRTLNEQSQEIQQGKNALLITEMEARRSTLERSMDSLEDMVRVEKELFEENRRAKLKQDKLDKRAARKHEKYWMEYKEDQDEVRYARVNKHKMEEEARLKREAEEEAARLAEEKEIHDALRAAERAKAEAVKKAELEEKERLDKERM